MVPGSKNTSAVTKAQAKHLATHPQSATDVSLFKPWGIPSVIDDFDADGFGARSNLNGASVASSSVSHGLLCLVYRMDSFP